jgi:aminopeptidase-like protein
MHMEYSTAITTGTPAGVAPKVSDDNLGTKLFGNLNPRGEPQLGPRGLYPTTGRRTAADQVKELPILWVLNLSDGRHSLLDIAERSGLAFREIRTASDALLRCGLIAELPTAGAA